MAEDILIVFGALPWILVGAGVTIATVFCALALGFLVGLPLAVGQAYGPSWLRPCLGAYVWFFRGVPILVLLYLFYFGLAPLAGIDLSAFAGACIVLGLTSGAYQSQIFRGAINALPNGQKKAAEALGMSSTTTICSIILPQALRISIPGWSNEYSILLKDSTLVAVIGTSELLSRIMNIATSTSRFTAFYITAAILYFIITSVGVRLLRFLENRWRTPGYTPM